MKVKVSVTEGDIRNSWANSVTNGPIARAASRAIGLPVSIFGRRGQIHHPAANQTIYLPLEAQAFLINESAHKPLSPITFEIEYMPVDGKEAG